MLSAAISEVCTWMTLQILGITASTMAVLAFCCLGVSKNRRCAEPFPVMVVTYA